MQQIYQSNNFYHGIRFDELNRLESIFQSRAILCARDIKDYFISSDGVEKYLYIDSCSDENCNMGMYVSVMPEVEGAEFNAFVLNHLFFAINGNVNAIKTKFVPYDTYINLIDEEKRNNYYSYAHHEYLIKEKIDFDDINYIGIDTYYYRGNIEETINDVINLMKTYDIEIPFVDYETNRILYQKGKCLKRGNINE